MTEKRRTEATLAHVESDGITGAGVERRATSALLGALILVIAEACVVVLWAHGEFAGTWEITAVAQRIVPLAWLASIPLALAAAALWRAADLSSVAGAVGAAGAKALLALAGVAGLAAVAWGSSAGRHFAALPVRLAFAAFAAALGGIAFARGLPLVTRFFARRPRAALVAVASGALVLELANLAILPRLYPAFHLALTAATLLAAPWLGDAVWRGVPASARRVTTVVTVVALFASLVGARTMSNKLALADNLRWIFVDRAPLAEQGLVLAARLTSVASEPSADDRLAGESPLGATRRAPDGPRLDWRGRDIVLITVDALRADHVGIYGYSRPTTPHIDALARSGIFFASAYCATPHTSYSVTSIMTGKNMRPLLLQGLGADSETWAELLRRYDYRSAAFYPPAVFFIDPERFEGFRDSRLGFEYARVKFSDPIERAREVEQYLAAAPADHPVFLWAHLFEPHEPYVEHPEHPFGDRDVDRYDAEIAAADDGIGEIVKVVRARRPHAIFIVTADHGEEFGEHGGRYHGTTVFEEQVHVPLIVTGEGIAAGGKITLPVQAIDLLPTVLVALDIPRPARMRGRDVGGILALTSSTLTSIERSWPNLPPPSGFRWTAPAQNFAFAETDEQTLLADMRFRLICNRRIAACALYDLATDPGELHDVSPMHRQAFDALRRNGRALEASQGDLERPTGAGESAPRTGWPGAMRRGMAGDADAALEVAALLDDADPDIRVHAAEISFRLANPDALPALRLARAGADDPTVGRWCSLALLRLGDKAEIGAAIGLLADPDIAWRRAAAQALAEAGDARGAAILVDQWQHRGDLPIGEARTLLGALARIRAPAAVAPLLRSLDDVRLRPDIVRALGAIGDPAARAPLLERFASERYEPARVALASALVDLGAKAEIAPVLRRFLGVPDPLPNGLGLAMRAGILRLVGGELVAGADVAMVVPARGDREGLRILVRGSTSDDRAGEVVIGSPFGVLRLTLPARAIGAADGGVTRGSAADGGAAWGSPADGGAAGTAVVEVHGVVDADRSEARPAIRPQPGTRINVHLEVSPNTHLEAIAWVPVADEIPPPPPEPWTEDPPVLAPR